MYVFLSVTAGAAILIASLSYIAYRKVFKYARKQPDNVFKGLERELTDVKKTRRRLIEQLIEIPYEDIFITSRDGKKLHARYYHVADDAPVALQFHGYKSMGVRDFSGIAVECMKLSQNVLIVDQRSHGESDGKRISFGIKERYDCLDWIKYINDRFSEKTKIILYGVSMGAATVLMASELEMPKNVIGIVADCPYSSPKAIIKKVSRDMKLPASLAYPFIRLGALIYGGFDPNKASPVSAVTKTSIPILLIHGENDGFVPCGMSDEIAKAGNTVKLIKFAEATHGTSILYDKDKYVKAVEGFTSKILSEQKDGIRNED